MIARGDLLAVRRDVESSDGVRLDYSQLVWNMADGAWLPWLGQSVGDLCTSWRERQHRSWEE
jgi:hypothetical protein